MIWTAFLVGLLGSLHCVGMCAPLAMALPSGAGRRRFVLGRLLYNGGRILTYILLGVLLGLLGEGISFAGFQQYLSVGAGVLLIGAALFPVLNIKTALFSTPVFHLTAFLKQRFARLFQKRSLSASFYTGLFNGLLPCGLVYVALAGAVALGDWTDGIIYMALFGAGTLPLMLTASLAGKMLPPKLKVQFQKAVPLIVTLLGIMLILRGMNLGIPYLSPEITFENGVQVTECN